MNDFPPIVILLLIGISLLKTEVANWLPITTEDESLFVRSLPELLEKGFVRELQGKDGKSIVLTDKGFKFLERYQTIVDFITEFEL
ncbi:hypothetical protein COV21_03390 [Candidatus Woesearchaeota archaeon CG10_big_fil_rev_8_21_14_0_10_45_5]|nr:MAG: hypothetical protein COV21_03390 [Candidatus Woesearchaeota archaeon CG10_big_fil_rev_8_21_14_0_10_45_5]